MTSEASFTLELAGCQRCFATVGDAENLGCPHGGHERAGEWPLNLKLLDAALEAIKGARKLLHDAEGDLTLTAGTRGPAWDQNSWREALSALDPYGEAATEGDDAEEVPRCGTAMCVAGWVDTLDGLPGERVWLVTDEQLMGYGPGPVQVDGLTLLVSREDDPLMHRMENEQDELQENEQFSSVVEADKRARRLLGLERAKVIVLRGRFTDDEKRLISSAGWFDALCELFDGTNSLELLDIYRERLGELNDWLVDRRHRWPSE